MGRHTQACLSRLLIAGVAISGAIALVGVAGTSFSLGAPGPHPLASEVAAGRLRASAFGTEGRPSSSPGLASTAASLCGAFVVAACAARGLASLARQAAGQKDAEPEAAPSSGRRSLFAAVATVGVAAPATEAFAAQVDVPDRIKEDPYELIGLANPEDSKEDKKEFYMKKKYRADTYQLVKHMKISGSLDKGTPNMEKWNKRVKEEMNDWVALYRRQDLVVGRQSYYSLYSAVNTLASHFTSYGPKFPFPSKRRARFYELINTTEKYLEKGK